MAYMIAATLAETQQDFPLFVSQTMVEHAKMRGLCIKADQPALVALAEQVGGRTDDRLRVALRYRSAAGVPHDTSPLIDPFTGDKADSRELDPAVFVAIHSPALEETIITSALATALHEHPEYGAKAARDYRFARRTAKIGAAFLFAAGVSAASWLVDRNSHEVANVSLGAMFASGMVAAGNGLFTYSRRLPTFEKVAEGTAAPIRVTTL